MSENKIILGFETSCDETAIAIMRNETPHGKLIAKCHRLE